MDSVRHFELPVDDMQRAEAFYAAAFGWTSMAPPGMEGQYELVTTAEAGESHQPAGPGRVNGALYLRASPDAGTLLSIEVDAIEEAIARVLAAGGEVALPVRDVTGYGYYARVRDSEGNLLVLWQPTPEDD